jgi:putative salt-induced outer membrane protein YdiY
MKIIDTHQHLWDMDLFPYSWCQTFPAADSREAQRWQPVAREAIRRRLRSVGWYVVNSLKEVWKMQKACLATLSMLVLTSTVLADQITMKNGDRLSGTIVTCDAKTLVLKTDYADAVTIKWDFVQQVESSQPLYVGTKGGQVVIGPVTTSGDKFAVATKESGSVAVAKADVTSLRNADEEKKVEAAQERLQHPHLGDLWTGSLDTGLGLVTGNSQSTNVTFGLNAVRVATRDKITYYTNGAFSRSTVNGVASTTAQAIAGGVRYDLNLSDKAFAFGTVDMLNDRFQALDLQMALGAGVGYHAIKDSRTTVDLLVGPSFVRQSFTTFNRSSGEVLLGESLTRKFGASSAFNEALFFYPNFTSTGDYRGTLSLGLVTKLSKTLSWQTSFNDFYLSNPAPGKKTNDMLLSTGLRVTFGGPAK